MLTALIDETRGKIPVGSDIVEIDFSFISTFHDCSKAREAINRMSNEQKGTFLKSLIKAIAVVSRNGPDSSSEERGELADLFGKEVLRNQVFTESGRFLYTLTAQQNQFRVWCGAFGSVDQIHFDSCGNGCFLSATCDQPDTLRKWAEDIVPDRMIEWKSTYGSVWMGFGH